MGKVTVPGLGRLKRAFKLLRARGYFAVLRTGWSRSEAVGSVPDGLNGSPLKYAVTMDQCHWGLQQDPSFEGCIYWGVSEPDGPGSCPPEIGWEILWALRESGVSASWSGDCYEAVFFRLDGNPIREVERQWVTVADPDAFFFAPGFIGNEYMTPAGEEGKIISSSGRKAPCDFTLTLREIGGKERTIQAKDTVGWRLYVPVEECAGREEKGGAE